MRLVSSGRLAALTATPGARNQLDEILAPIHLALQAMGFHLLDDTWTWKKNIIKIICSFLLWTYPVIGTCVVLKQTEDRLLQYEVIFNLVAGLQLAKGMILAAYTVSCRKAYIIAKSTILDIVAEVNPERLEHLFKRLRLVIRCLVISSVIIPNLVHTSIFLFYYFHGVRKSLPSGTSLLMPMTSPYHEIGSLLHLVFLMSVTLLIIVPDIFYIFFILLFCEASSCAVKVLGVRRVADDGVPYATRLDDALRKFYTIHVKIMEYIHLVNFIYKWPLLVPTVGILMSTCFVLIVLMEDFNPQLLSILITATIQICMYNILGEIVKSKISEINSAIFEFDWVSMRLEDKKKYYIIVCYLNKDFSMKSVVGELSLLSLSNFYKGTYQAFAVLNQMRN